jgi:hypothetical protein
MKNRFHHTVQQLGWLDAAWYAVAQLLTRASGGGCTLYKYRIVAQAVATSSLCRGRGAAIEVRRISEPAACGFEFQRRPHIIARRYRQGAQCLAAYRGGELLGYLWYTLGAYQEDEVRARFVPATAQAAWDFDVQVFAEHQLGLAFPRLWDEANRALHAHGVRWSCSRISAFNAGSRSAHRSLGAVVLGSAVFIRYGRWQWMASSLAPWVHVSHGPDSFPQFRVEPP